MRIPNACSLANSWFFEEAPDACFITDLDSRFIDVNHATERLLGYSRSELLGEPLLSLKFLQPGEIAQLMACWAPGAPSSAFRECTVKHHNGSNILVEIGTRFVSREEKPSLLGIARPVSERGISSRSAAGQRTTSSKQVWAASKVDLHGALEAAHVGTFRLEAPSCEPVYWSEECYRMLGFDPSGPLPSRSDFLNAVVQPRQKEQSRRLVEKCAREGIPFDYQYQVASAEKTVRWVHSKGVPIFDDGAIIGIHGTIQDVTDRMFAEQSLRESEQRFQTIFDSEPQCIKLLDRKGRLIDMNPSGLSMVEADSLEEIRDQCIYPIIVPEYREAFVTANEESFSGKWAKLQFEIIGLRGTRRWMDSQVVPLRGSDGTIIASLSVTSEITEQKRTEQQLQLSQFSVETAVEGVYWIRPEDGRFLYVNESACKSMGYSRDELLGLSVADIDKMVSKDSWPQLSERVRAQGNHEMESTHMRKDGSSFPVEINLTHLHADSAEFFCAQVRDTTVRKHAEESIIESRRFIEAVAEASPHIIYVINVESLDFTYFNRSLTAELGFGKTVEPPSDVRELVQLMPEADHQHLDAVVEQWRNMEEGKIREDEYHFFAPDGSIQSFMSRETVFLGSPNSPVRQILGTAMNITERKRSDEERRSLQLQLQHTQKMDAIGQLASGVAHEFNNLLMAIRGNTEMLLLSPLEQLSENARLSLREIERGCERASTLTQQLLSFARKKDPRSTVFNVNDLITNSYPMLRRLIGREKKLELTLAQTELMVNANEPELEQALLNLVLNAHDATPQGGTLQIRTALTQSKLRNSDEDTPSVRISVLDDGCGMSQTTQERAFEPFFTTKPTGKGTGLGLSTVFSDIARCNGHVSINSVPGTGTAVDIYLPLSNEPSASPHSFANAGNTGKGGTETILVCDDEPIVLTAMSSLLECVGYNVLCASSAENALALVGQESSEISLLITDVTMPEMDGFTLGRQLRDRFPKIRVIYISGYTADRTAAAALGEVEFLTKGCSSRTILERVRSVLDQG